MASILVQDPKTSEARSPLIAGLTDACNKLSSILDLKTKEETIELENLPISKTDKNRIYQAPVGKKLWLNYPAPIFRKNGSEINIYDDEFEIDYVGGSISFYPGHNLSDDDVVIAEVTRISNESNKIEEILSNITKSKELADRFKGLYFSEETLTATQTDNESGDFAFVVEDDVYYIYVFDNEWNNIFEPDITPDEVTSIWEGPIDETVSAMLYHKDLLGRDDENQHPIEAITGLNEATNEEILAIWKGVN